VSELSLKAIYMVQPVVKPVWELFGQQVVSCIQKTSNRLSNRLCSIVQPVRQPVASCKQTSNQLYNRFDNQLHRVNGVWRHIRNNSLTHSPPQIMLLFEMAKTDIFHKLND